MSGIQLFTPKTAGTRQVTCAASTATLAISVPATAETIRVYNSDTTNIGYVEFGTSSAITCVLPVTTTTGGMPIPPGQVVGVGCPLGTTHIATICSAGTPILYVTPGNGV